MKQLIAFLIMSSLLVACGGPEPIHADDSGATPERIESVAQGNNRFAIDLYKEVKDSRENLFFSPYSISTALAMTYEGARGETAEEMATTLHLPTDDEIRRSGFASLHNALQGKQEGFEISTANALWIVEGYPIIPDYLSKVRSYYGGEAETLDPVDPVGQVNGWVEERTKNRIRDIVKSIPPLTRVILANAIYFKGDWVWEFDEERTQEQPFHLSEDESVMVELMTRPSEEAKFGYAEDEEVQVLQLPYRGERLSMLIILPKEIEGLSSVEDSLTIERLDGWRGELRKRNLPVYIPKFEFTDSYGLVPILSGMGMPKAFSEYEADFSGMTTAEQLYIGEVLHKAFIKVDEKGTEAAAATVVMSLAGSAGPSTVTVFRADHPFLFLIQDDESGAILFMGRIADPSALKEE